MMVKKVGHIGGQKERSCCCRGVHRESTARTAAVRTVYVKQERRSFAFYCEEWLTARGPELKESSKVKYGSIVEKHIQPFFGDCLPGSITTPRIEAFKQELLASGLSPKTVKDILVVLREILIYTGRNTSETLPAVEFCYPKEPKLIHRVLSPEEQRRFCSYLCAEMDQCKFGTLLALLTGLRIGELCALRWDSISLEEKTLTVTATMQRLRDDSQGAAAKTRIVIDAPKSSSSLRVIPLTEQAAALCAVMRTSSPAAYVLTGSEQYMEPRTLQYRLKRYTAACGLEHVHFHTLRHTFATRCMEAGFEVKCLSEILGHANTSVTLERYVHASMPAKRANMDKLAAVGL